MTHRLLRLSCLAFVAVPVFLAAAEPSTEKQDLAAALRDLNGTVSATDADKAKQLAQMIARDARNRLATANQRETKQWREAKTRADWERYRDPRLQALRASLGAEAAVPKDLKLRVTRQLDGDGYRVENIVFESRPGLLVTANLYVPKEPAKSMPGIVICPSHHNPKTQGELQDMGMSWARLGCVVLVPDNLGHGERRQHPFTDASQYPEKFRPSRQDYYFRYNTAMQLHVVGESLVGWMVWDLCRCVDVLLARPGVDKERILLLGSVAGGGDPAAVAAALDPRITAVAPFNFGGPQPETVHPLPDDAEAAFNYAGSGSWESTRSLRLSARDGFLPWVIVGAAAPRRLMYAHEFAWDRERDPVWSRLQKIYGYYEVPDRLGSAHGKGSVRGQPPESTHCNNIGAVHRAAMYPALNRWLAFGGAPEKEYTKRRPAEELLCVTPDSGIKLKPLYELTAALGKERSQAARDRLAALKPEERSQHLRQDWKRLLGEIEPKAPAKATVAETRKLDGATVESIVLEVEPGIVVPALLLLPAGDKARSPVVVAVAQEGKQEFLKKRAEGIAELLKARVAVCLPDLRGTGETRPGDGRGRGSWATSISATEQMLGRTLLGSRLRDLRSVLKYLRGRPDVDAARIALWGDSFAPTNPEDTNLRVPLDADKLPAQSEPLGGLLALLGALFEPEIRAVYAHGGLSGFDALLQGQFCWLPHDAVIPGALTTGDLCDVAAALAPRPVRLTGLVDGQNRRVNAERLGKTYEPAHTAYRALKAEGRFVVEPDAKGVTDWLRQQVQAR